MAKLLDQARELREEVTSRLVRLYNRLKSGKLSEEERLRVKQAIAELRRKVKTDTKRLIGHDGTPEPGMPGATQGNVAR